MPPHSFTALSTWPKGDTPSRRRFVRGVLAGTAAALAGTSIASCGTAAAAGDGTLQLWDLFSGADGALLNEMIDKARPAMGRLTIERTVLEWGPPYYTKLAMASAGGRGPDLAICHLSRLAGYAPTGLLTPWNVDLLSEYGVQPDDFAEAVRARTGAQGRTYAIPLDTHPFITFYHPDLADRAGLLDKDGKLDLDAFSSPQGFLQASRELARASGKQGVAFGYVTDAAQLWRLFYGLYRQTGADLKLRPGGRAEADPDKMTHVIEFMTKLIDGKVNPGRLDYASSIAAFANRQTGMILSGEWELATFRAANPKVGAATFPTVFDKPAVYADAHSFVLPRDVPQPRLDRAHRFVAAILKAGQTWAKAGHIPAYQPVTRTSAYHRLSPQADYLRAQDHVVFDPPAWFTGAGSDFQNTMSQILQTAVLGNVAPDQAARSMLRRADTFLSKPDPA